MKPKGEIKSGGVEKYFSEQSEEIQKKLKADSFCHSEISTRFCRNPQLLSDARILLRRICI